MSPFAMSRDPHFEKIISGDRAAQLFTPDHIYSLAEFSKTRSRALVSWAFVHWELSPPPRSKAPHTQQMKAFVGLLKEPFDTNPEAQNGIAYFLGRPSAKGWFRSPRLTSSTQLELKKIEIADSGNSPHLAAPFAQGVLEKSASCSPGSTTRPARFGSETSLAYWSRRRRCFRHWGMTRAAL